MGWSDWTGSFIITYAEYFHFHTPTLKGKQEEIKYEKKKKKRKSYVAKYVY